MDTQQPRRLLRDREAAHYLGVHVNTLRQARAAGDTVAMPPCVRIGRRCVRYDLRDLDEWIERMKGDTR